MGFKYFNRGIRTGVAGWRPASAVSFCLLLSAIRCLLPASVNSADWPTFRGNWARTGYSAEQAAPPLDHLWTFQAGGAIMSSPAVFDGSVYFGDRSGTIYAVDAGSGNEIWRFRTMNRVDASPSVSSGTVYAASTDGYLYALDRLTGGLIWRAELGAPSLSSPLVRNGRVYVGTGLPENKLKVFDVLTGNLLGVYQVSQPVDSAPSAYGDNVYFGSNTGDIHAINGGTFLPPAGWTDRPTDGSFLMNAVAVSTNGIIYALPGHDEKSLFAVDAVTGNERVPGRSVPVAYAPQWETFTSPVVGGGRVYFSCALAAGDETVAAGDNYLSAWDAGTLASVWASSRSLGAIADMGMLSSPAMANDVLYAGTADGRLVAISSEGASAAAAINLSSPAYSSPAVSNGRIFIGTIKGELFAFGAQNTSAVSSPAPGDIVSGTVTVRGYVSNSALSGYTLEYGPGAQPADGDWVTLVSSVTAAAVHKGALAEWYTTLLPPGDYTLRLTALPVSGLDNTARLTVRVNAPPLPPSGLTVSDIEPDNGNHLQLNWTASPSGGITVYKIYRDAGEGLTELSTVAAALHAYTDAAATTGVDFTYAVSAFDGYVESVYSSTVSAHSVNDSGDNIPPSPITDLAASQGAAPGSVLLSWTATGNDGNLGTPSHYVIKYASYAWADFDDAALRTAILPAAGPSGDNVNLEIGGLFGGVTYYFAVKTADFVPNPCVVSNSTSAWATIDLVPPLPPAGLTVSDTPWDEGNSLDLSWTLSPDDGALANDVYGYRIYRRLQNSAYVSSAPYASMGKGVNRYIDSAATTNVRFYYSVAAFDSGNNSELSNEASAVASDNWRFFDATQGGSVRLPDGARVDIPVNAASQNDNIMFTKLDPNTFQPLFKVKANTVVRQTGIVYEVKFKNSATTLLKPAVISLPYADTDVAGMNLENLRLYTFSGGAWLMVNTSKPDPVAKRVSAEVGHFSVYSIMEYVPSGDVLNEAEVYTYPNPATSSSLTFKFRPSDKALVKIDVYNIAGEKVAKFSKGDCPAGLTSEIVWGIENIASGVYQYRVEAVSASGTKSVIKRLAVIH